MNNIINSICTRANPPLSGEHKKILYNISNPTFARANPPFKGGRGDLRGDFYKIKTIINNLSNPTFARANPPFKGKCDLAFATDHQKWRLATQILNGRFVGDFFKIKTIINNISNPTFARANPPFKGGRGDFYKIKTIINNLSNPTLSRANPPLSGGHKEILYNIINPTFTRANPPFKGGRGDLRGDFFKIKTIMNKYKQP